MSTQIIIVLLILLLVLAVLGGCAFRPPQETHDGGEKAPDPQLQEPQTPEPREEEGEEVRELKPQEENPTNGDSQPGEPRAGETVKRPSGECENIEFEIIDRRTLEGHLKEKLGGSQPEQGMTIVEEGGYKYILVSAGRKPTAGYSVTVGSLLGYEDAIVLNALLNSPGAGDMVAQVITYPALLIRIPADERKVILYLTDTRNTYQG